MALLQVKFFSNVLGKCVSMEVCLPQTTNGQIGMEGKAETTFPTLYLLHGMSDDETIWERRTSIERYATAKGIAVVMPTTELGWYTDMECGYQKYYTFIAKELPAVCRGFFRGMSDKREDNWIAGLSMGGYGALKIALNESETFGKAAGLSGAYDICKYPETPYWQSIFGEGKSREKHTIKTAISLPKTVPNPTFISAAVPKTVCFPQAEIPKPFLKKTALMSLTANRLAVILGNSGTERYSLSLSG